MGNGFFVGRRSGGPYAVRLVMGDDAFEPASDLLGELDHFQGFLWFEVALAVGRPQLKPCPEMLRPDAEVQVFGGHLAGVKGGTSGDSCPEFPNLCQVFRPVIDMLVENRADECVLPDVGVEVS